METKEIMENEEIMVEEYEDIVDEHVNPGVMMAVGAGIATLVVGGGTLAYKKLVKPGVAKIKAKVEQKRNDKYVSSEKVSFIDKMKDKVNKDEEPEDEL